MFPTLFTYQGLGFHSWGLMVMTAFFAACMYSHVVAPKVGIDSDKLVPLYLTITICGLLGSRLLHFLMAEPANFFAHPMAFFDINQGGFAFYGGVIGGIGSGVIYTWIRKIPTWKLADIASAAIMLGLGVGRIGCFLAGCCHGRACDAPFRGSLLELPGGAVVTVDGFPFVALTFKPGVGVGDIHNIPVFPTQLWEITTGFTLFLLLRWMWKRARRFDGQILAAMLMTYPIIRSTIETFRGDSVRGTDYFGFLSTSQVVSIPLFAIGLVIIALQARKGRAPEVEFVYKDDEEE